MECQPFTKREIERRKIPSIENMLSKLLTFPWGRIYIHTMRVIWDRISLHATPDQHEKQHLSDRSFWLDSIHLLFYLIGCCRKTKLATLINQIFLFCFWRKYALKGVRESNIGCRSALIAFG